MQGIWYGDRRDRVKWGALYYLACRERIPTIAQVAFYRETATAILEISRGNFEPIPDAVRNHFSNLEHIKRLQGHGVKRIEVFGRPWSRQSGADYMRQAVEWLAGLPGPRKLVFLDPDTGVAPPSGAGPQHVRKEEIEQYWNTLGAQDWLALYQHAAHSHDWVAQRRRAFLEACNKANRHEVYRGTGATARDVAIFAATRM
jgi:hypothetical protein